MWLYIQKTGELLHNGAHVGFGYSGHGIGKNNPDMQNVKRVGPLPCGWYTIEKHVDTEDHGPFCLPLTPDAANEMFGRADFLMHGDKIGAPGTASEGCIIQAHDVRVDVERSGDNRLQVISGS